MSLSQSSRPLEQEKLEEMAKIFLKQLVKEQPHLQPEIEKNFKVLVDNICKTMSNLMDNRRAELRPRDLADPNFIKEMCIALVSILKMKPALINDPQLLPKLKLLLDPKNRSRLNNPKELEKLFKELLTLKELEQLKKDIKDEINNIVDLLVKCGLVKPNPKKTLADVKEELAKRFDAYENLFGLINSAVTGGIPIVVLSYMGNGLGFADWNPNMGLANIDRVNNPNDTAQPDPLALNASTMGNFLQFVGTAFAESFQNDLRQEGLAISSTPSLTRQ